MEELQVKTILAQRQISVANFAMMLGITREHCYYVINGKNVSQKQLKKMAEVLNLPIRALYTAPEELATIYNPFDIDYDRIENYKPNDIITFCRPNELYGEFSNMNMKYPVNFQGKFCKTTEHLFLALRFSGYLNLQAQILNEPSALYCKQKFKATKYIQYHHPNWSDNDFDIEIMKMVIQLKYEQNSGFRKLLAKTKGKVLVEDTTLQSPNINAVSRWGCVDLRKRNIIKETQSQVSKFLTSYEKELKAKEASLKHPRTKTSQDIYDAKRRAEKSIIKQLEDIYERTLFNNCTYTLTGRNALGKILMEIRDTGKLDYHLDYPLYFFDNEIKRL